MIDFSHVPGEGVTRRGAHFQDVGVGGGAGGMPGSIARPSNDLTPALVRARFTEAQIPSRLTLTNDNTLNGGTAHASTPLITRWWPVEVDRPTIFWPLENINGGQSVDSNTGDPPTISYVGALIQYWPSKIPPTSVGFLDAYVSNRHGICFLSGPGTWWLQHTNIQRLASTTITGLLLDCADPATAARLMNEPGCNAAGVPTTTDGSYYRAVTAAVTQQLCPANRNRTSLLIQNTGRLNGGTVSGSSIRLSFGIAANPNSGILLGPGGSLTLQGDTLWKGRVFVILDANSGALAVDAIAQEFQ